MSIEGFFPYEFRVVIGDDKKANTNIWSNKHNSEAEAWAFAKVLKERHNLDGEIKIELYKKFEIIDGEIKITQIK